MTISAKLIEMWANICALTWIPVKDRKLLYNNYNKDGKDQRISKNHRKVSTVYCAPIFRNLLTIHTLSAFSFDPEHKYLTSLSQQ